METKPEKPGTRGKDKKPRKKRESRCYRDDVEAIKTFVAKATSGASNVQLAKKLGISRNTVHDRIEKCKKYGLELDVGEIVQQDLVPEACEAGMDLLRMREPSTTRLVLQTCVLPAMRIGFNPQTASPDEVIDHLGGYMKRIQMRKQEQEIKPGLEQETCQDEEKKPESVDAEIVHCVCGKPDHEPWCPARSQGGTRTEGESGDKESLSEQD